MADNAAASGAAHDPTVVTRTLADVSAETGLSVEDLEALIARDKRATAEAYRADEVRRLEGKVQKQRAQLADAEAGLKAARAAAKGA